MAAHLSPHDIPLPSPIVAVLTLTTLVLSQLIHLVKQLFSYNSDSFIETSSTVVLKRHELLGLRTWYYIQTFSVPSILVCELLQCYI